jgi:hypothetical protein
MFMDTLAAKGMPPMFIEAAVDVDERDTSENYLATATINMSAEVFIIQLKAGASSARAIPTVCRSIWVDN